MSPTEFAAVISAASGLAGGLVTAVSVATGLHWGREKAKADAELAREQVGKAKADRLHAETSAQLESIAGDISARLDTLDEAVADVRHEVTPNHGGSMKDALNRVENAQATVLQTLNAHSSALDAHSQILDAHSQILSQIAARQDSDTASLSTRIDTLTSAAAAEHDMLRQHLTEN